MEIYFRRLSILPSFRQASRKRECDVRNPNQQGPCSGRVELLQLRQD